MQNIEAIKYLDTLEMGDCLTVNIPIFRNETAKVTVVYAGKDKEGRYEFIDNGEFVLSKELLQKGKVSIDKGFDEKVAKKIYKRIRKEYEKFHKTKKDRDVR